MRLMTSMGNVLLKDNSETNLAHILSYAILAGIVLYIIVEAIMYKFFRRHYHGIRFTTKNIATIAVMTGLSASVTIVISMTIPVTVFPPVRIGFEGIMIKISGMFFGPIVGMIVGLITELLTVLFVPSYIHPAYLIVALGFGFLSGIASYSKKMTGSNKRWIILGIITTFIVAFGVWMEFTTNSYTGVGTDKVKFFGAEISHEFYKYLFIIILAITLIIIWGVVLGLIGKKRMKIVDTILPIILMVVFNEFLVSTTISPWGDQGFLGIPPTAGGYASILSIRLLESPFKIVVNTIILSTVYYVLRPLIKKD